MASDYYKKDEVERMAQGRWSQILRDLAGLSPDQLSNRSQPCPMCGGEDRYNYDDRYSAGNYFCRGCGPGNGWSILNKKLGLSFPEALKQVAEYLKVNKSNMPVVKNNNNLKAIYPTDKSLEFKNKSARLFDKTGQRSYVHSYQTVWDWLDEDSKRIGYIARKENKTTHQVYLTSKGWTQGSIGEDRPLFGLQNYKSSKKLLIVEGEKVQAKCQEILPDDWCCVTWTGGCQAVRKSNWKFIESSKIYIAPDNDPQGFKAANYIKSLFPNSKIMKMPEGKPEGWDLADFIDEDMMLYEELIELIEGAAEKEEKERSEGLNYIVEQIRPLGYNENKIFLMPVCRMQIAEMNMAELGQSQLRTLIPREEIWYEYFPKKVGVDWNRAAEFILEECLKRGPYKPDKVRGRGIWKDGDNYIAHLGDKLVVDKNIKPIQSYSSKKYVYLLSEKLINYCDETLNDDERDLMSAIFAQLKWMNPVSGVLLGGYIVCSFAAGVLKWRPHIQITGPAGSGKTTILREIVTHALGGFSLLVEGETTEAGIRQGLEGDARAVVFDEAETNEKHDYSRQQRNYALARISSSGSEVFKGTPNNKVNKFALRSCFCFSSITVGIKQKADQTRIAVLELAPQFETNKTTEQHWDHLKKMLYMMPPDLSEKIFKTTMTNIELILENIDVFSDCLAEKSGSRRLGDQYGTLLGAYYSVFEKLEIIKREEAMEFIQNFNWDIFEHLNKDTQELEALDIIKSLIVDVPKFDGGSSKLTIGELITYVLSSPGPGIVSSRDASETLRRYGIKVDLVRNSVFVSKSDQNLARILRTEPWMQNWSMFLKRLSGVCEPNNSVYFGEGKRVRCVQIPISYFMASKDSNPDDESKSHEDQKNLDE